MISNLAAGSSQNVDVPGRFHWFWMLGGLEEVSRHDCSDSLKGARDFLTLFVIHERRLRNFTRVLVYQSNDADEVFQEASVTMLEKFDSLGPDSDFARWGCRIILYKVMELRRRRVREKLRYSDTTVEALAGHAESMIASLGERSLALQNCMRQLAPTSRLMLIERYEFGHDIDTIARKFETSVQAVYRSLSRSRKQLHHCISMFLAHRKEV
jgi:RNA polymerase sigma-70 factor (ECF subfamily)